jgi:hypothetical protein
LSAPSGILIVPAIKAAPLVVASQDRRDKAEKATTPVTKSEDNNNNNVEDLPNPTVIIMQ